MDKKRIEVIITGVFVVILLFAWINAMKTIKKRSRPKRDVSQPTAFQNATGFSPVQLTTAKSLVSETPEYNPSDDLGWVRCVFSGKFYTSQESASNLDLTGILWDDVDPQAVINQEIFRREDRIDKYVIIDIRKDRVILNDGEKNFELKLEQY